MSSKWRSFLPENPIPRSLQVLPYGILVVGIVLTFYLTNTTSSGLRYKANIVSEGINLATALLVVAVFLERALAVINNLIFNLEEKDAEEAFFTSSDPASTKNALARLAVVNAKKERLRLAVGFAFGLLVSGAGPRILEGLLVFPPVPPTPALTPQRQELLFCMDIILTAGLLAGGSNGLNAIIEILRLQVQKTYWYLIKNLKATKASM